MGVKKWNDNVVPWRWCGLEEISPGVISIDVPNYMTRRLTVMKTESSPEGRIPLAHVGTFLSVIKSTLSSNILPVLLFDGPPESRKRLPNPELIQTAHSIYREFAQEGDPYNEEISRELLRSKAIRMYFSAAHIKDLSRAVGIPAVTAPSEAEMFAAAMCRNDLVKTVVSNDVDALLFGSPHVTKQLQISSNRILRAKLNELEANMELDLELLRDLAILSGCDFHDGLRGIGPRKGAILLRRYGSLIDVLKAKGVSHTDREDFVRAREVFDEPNYLTMEGLDLRLNPPILTRLTRLLRMVMSEAAVEATTEKILRLWKDFGSQQSTLEQWL
ncbi:MAG: hypothetical protein ACFFFK_08275 [Candidatus Thorarchaeota archaeon]